MRLKVTKVEDGLHPSQVSVSVNAVDGAHFLVLSRTTVDSASSVEVGNPVGHRGGDVLVELPTETDSGAWRLWVNRDSLSESIFEAAE